MFNKKTNVNITFGHICVHLIECVIKKQMLILLLDTFGPFLDICVYLIKWVIKKQMWILLLETYVAI